MHVRAPSRQIENRPGGPWPRRGFTLIEVLVATAIFATVLIAINTVFYGALHLQRTTTRVVEDAIPMSHAVRIIKEDLRSILPPGQVQSSETQSGGTLAGPIVGGAVSGTMGATLQSSPGGLVLGMASGYPSLQIYTTSGVADDSGLSDPTSLPINQRPWPEIQRVSYYLRNPLSTTNQMGKELVRVVTRNLLPLTDELPSEQPLLEGVENIEFQFFDGTSWMEWWDSTTVTNPLQAIRMQIEFVADLRNERLTKPPIELVVPVVVEASTNQTATATATASANGGPTQNTGTTGGSTTGGASGGGTSRATTPAASTGASSGGGRTTGGGATTGGGRTTGGGGTTGGGATTGGGRTSGGGR